MSVVPSNCRGGAQGGTASVSTRVRWQNSPSTLASRALKKFRGSNGCLAGGGWIFVSLSSFFRANDNQHAKQTGSIVIACCGWGDCILYSTILLVCSILNWLMLHLSWGLGYIHMVLLIGNGIGSTSRRGSASGIRLLRVHFCCFGTYPHMK